MFCATCGKENPDNAQFCGSCGRPLLRPAAPAQPRTSGMAIASLVLGLLGLSCGLTAIPGLILGIVGLRRINRSGGQLGGSGFAIAGICVSAGVLLLALIWIAVATIILTGLGGHTRDAMTNVSNTIGNAY